MVFEMGVRILYSCCFVGCCLQYSFNGALGILGQLQSSFLSIRLVSIYVVHPFSSTDMSATWKNCTFAYFISIIQHVRETQWFDGREYGSITYLFTIVFAPSKYFIFLILFQLNSLLIMTLLKRWHNINNLHI